MSLYSNVKARVGTIAATRSTMPHNKTVALDRRGRAIEKALIFAESTAILLILPKIPAPSEPQRSAETLQYT